MADTCLNCNCPCLLIDRGCVIRKTPMTAHVDDNELQQSIDIAQGYIMGLLGDCFETLCTQLEEETPAQIWTDLKTALEDTIAWYTFMTWLQFYGTAKITRQGIKKKTAEDSNETTTEETSEMIKAAQGQAERHFDVLRQWIKTNKADYTCLDTDCCCTTCGAACDTCSCEDRADMLGLLDGTTFV